MQLKIGTKTFDRFTKVPIPLTVKYYLFNITNSEQVLRGDERPQFQQVGPFMYKQWRRREIVDFEDYNRRLRYREIKTFYPMFKSTRSRRHNNIESMHNISSSSSSNMTDSERPLVDPASVNVTIVNVPLLSLLTKLAQMEAGSMKRKLASQVASKLIASGRERILITKPANELLFDGYRVNLMESARELLSDYLGYNFPSPLPNNTFGFFFNKNNTWSRKENGELTVYTGRNDSMRDFMLVDNWNDLQQLKVWPTNTAAGNRCNLIKGTDGSQFHPGVSKSQVLDIFSPLICTSIQIKYLEETSARDIPLLRFGTAPDTFAAPKKRPQNACYCSISNSPSQPQTTATGSDLRAARHAEPTGGAGSSARIDDSRCYLDGLIDLSLCQNGAPVAISSPHFYSADPMLAMAAGLKPDKQLHETYLDIEPMTGAVFRAASRAQLNAFVESAALSSVDSKLIGKMTPMIAPLLWLEESAEIDHKSALEFKGQLLNLVQKAKRSFVYAILVGFLLTLAVSGQYWYATCYRFREEPKTVAKRKQQRRKDNLRVGATARDSNLAQIKADARSLPILTPSGSSRKQQQQRRLRQVARADLELDEREQRKLVARETKFGQLKQVSRDESESELSDENDLNVAELEKDDRIDHHDDKIDLMKTS